MQKRRVAFQDLSWMRYLFLHLSVPCHQCPSGLYHSSALGRLRYRSSVRRNQLYRRSHLSKQEEGKERGLYQKNQNPDPGTYRSDRPAYISVGTNDKDAGIFNGMLLDACTACASNGYNSQDEGGEIS